MKLTARELKFFRLALDKGASPQEAAAAAKAFVESMRARGASSYEAVPESRSRPRPEPPPQPSSPPSPPPQPKPPPKYEPNPPPPREETPPWWTRAKDQPPPEPARDFKTAYPYWDSPEQRTPHKPDNGLRAALCLVILLGFLLVVGYYSNQAKVAAAAKYSATASPTPSAIPIDTPNRWQFREPAKLYISSSYRFVMPDGAAGFGPIKGILDSAEQLPNWRRDKVYVRDAYYCKQTQDSWLLELKRGKELSGHLLYLSG